MAAGTGAASGTGRGSSAALQSSLDRRFQGVSNTMESIQGLSNWCIENKKYHNFIVRCWMKWLKKSGASQMLNLFYVANDVIQNCKRKNAIIYRTSFSEVLPEATRLVKDAKVRNSVERILTIWEERSVYPEELISELRAGLVKKAPPSAPVNPKTALKSKILAEFAPQAFIEKLSQHRRALEEAELKEKQLAALRVDVCSTEALKRLKDKAGGKKFSKDFEEGSTKLQEFVGYLEQQLKGGPPLLEALSNADVFYEMQYKEVKIIANAYKTFANRVTHLKRKLDALKASLPGVDDSPVPSPSEDAPSPTGSESPFRGMDAVPGPLDGTAMDEEEDGDAAAIALGDAPSPLSSPGGPSPPGERDNRDVEDMELSEGEEAGGADIIVEECVAKPVPIPEPEPAKPLLAQEGNPVKQAPPPTTPVTPMTPATPATPLPVNLANVDLGKISSILSSLTSVMKNTGVSPVSRTSPRTPTTPSPHSSAPKPSPAAAAAAAGVPAPGPTPLASILSRVDIRPESILSALSKTQGAGLQGISLLQSVTGGSSGPSSVQQPTSTAPPRGHASGPPEAPPAPMATPEERGPATPLAPKPKPPPTSGYRQDTDSRGTREQETERESTPPVSSFPNSLESKIHKFLQGNPGFRTFNLGPTSGDGQGSSSNSPFLAAENLDGTPVRDEAPGTPTQDEMMDEPGPKAFVTNVNTNAPAPASSHNGGIRDGMGADHASLAQAKNPLSSSEFGRRGDGSGLSPTAYRGESSWGAGVPGSPQRLYGEGGVIANSQEYRPLRRPDLTSGGPRDANRDGYGAGEFYDGGRSDGARGGDGRGVTAGEHYLPLRPVSAGDRPRSTGEAAVPPDGRGGGEGGSEPDATANRYRHIETLVSPSSCGDGAPVGIPAGYGGRRPSGERIQTVESIRVIDRGVRPGVGGAGSGDGGWYGEAYAEGAGARPRNPGPAAHGRPDDPHRLFPFEERGRAPYSGRDPQRPRIPPSDFFSSPPPPIPPPPPPPIPQLPPPPKDFLGPPSSVMVGGVLVPVDRALPPSRGGEGEERSGTPSTPPAHFKDLAPHSTVKDHFPPRQAPPLHRPPSSMLGRVREGPSPPPPLDPPHLQRSQHPPGSPPLQPHGPRRPPSPILRQPLPNHRPQLRPLHHQPRPPPSHLSQRPPLRGPLPRALRPAHFDHELPYHGGKRPVPHFGGTPRGGFGGSPFYPPKRPYLPPRY